MSKTKKQTAIEWLYNHLFPKQLDGFSSDEWDKIDKAFNQAKAMEKQQIMDAFEQQVIQWTPEILEDGTLRVSNTLKTAEQYYNENYETI